MSFRARLVLAAAYLLATVVIALTVPLALNIDRRATSELESDVVANATVPGTSANSVWSLPMPTLMPGWILVPRWRMMMLPALISSPP